ncbi:MAG: glycosyltransferase family 2 protein [Clostridia bacterium]|nr:glycosyltransferase family 2 protein [Clostridia bacterium]
MKTAVIILNYNSKNDTIRYVNKIKNYEVLDTIIVVDNKSTNSEEFKDLKLLQSEKVRVILSNQNGGYSYGNNFGLKYLEALGQDYDYVVISNPDVEVSKEAFEACFQELEENEKLAVCAPIMLNWEGNHIRRSSWKIRTPGIDMINSSRLNEALFYKWFRDGEYREEEYKQEKLEVECVSGAFFAIKLNLFKQIGYFDENVFLFYEEDILASKLKKLGYKEMSLNSVSFKHFESQSIGKAMSYFNKIKRLQTSKMYFQKTYHHISSAQVALFTIINYWRRLELLFEIPIRKIMGK